MKWRKLEDERQIMKKTDGRREERERENAIIFGLKTPNDLIICVGHVLALRRDKTRLTPSALSALLSIVCQR